MGRLLYTDMLQCPHELHGDAEHLPPVDDDSPSMPRVSAAVASSPSTTPSPAIRAINSNQMTS